MLVHSLLSVKLIFVIHRRHIYGFQPFARHCSIDARESSSSLVESGAVKRLVLRQDRAVTPEQHVVGCLVLVDKPRRR